MPAAYRELGALIRGARTRKGLRQKDVSMALDVSQGTVIAWEGGKVRPENYYDALARLLDLDAELLRLMGAAAHAKMRAAEETERATDLARQLEQHLDETRQ